MQEAQQITPVVYYRHRPWGGTATWLAVALLCFSCVIFFAVTGHSTLDVIVVLAIGGAASAIGAWFVPTRTVTATDSEIILRRASPLGVARRVERYAANNIRRVRYRTEKFRSSGAESNDPDIHHIVDMVLRDGTIVPLIRSKIFPLQPGLGKRLAAQVGAEYAEFLDQT